jgi:ABC-2 type transport system ATP-binding protein
VTVIVTTHFMPEAEYCDRAAILDSGRVLAQGTPAELRAHAHVSTPGASATIEDAFVAIVQEARGKQHEGAPGGAPGEAQRGTAS